jgi:hypothetical protein
MRTRQEIEEQTKVTLQGTSQVIYDRLHPADRLLLEALLDIRDLLLDLNKHNGRSK